jgi:hypothetical protein
MTNQEIKEINEAAIAKMDAEQAVAADLQYRKEKFRQNFSIDALLYYKLETLTRLHGYQKEQEYFSRQAAESIRKEATATDNISIAKDEIRAIETVISEKQAEIKRKSA